MKCLTFVDVDSLAAALSRGDSNMRGAGSSRGKVYVHEVPDVPPTDGKVRYFSGRMSDAVTCNHFTPLDTSETVFDELAWEVLREDASAFA